MEMGSRVTDFSDEPPGQPRAPLLSADAARHTWPATSGTADERFVDERVSSSSAPATTSWFSPKPKPLTWQGVSMLMVSDIVGTSVLTFPAVAAKLGWVPTVFLIVALFPVSVYTSVLMARTVVRMSARASMITAGLPGIDSMGTAARLVFGSQAGALVFVFVYGYVLLGNASYLLVLGTSVQGMLYDERVCLAGAVGLGCVFLAPFVVGLRRLRESVTLCFFNLLLILGVIGVAVASLAARGRDPCVQTHLFARGLDVMTVFNGATNLCSVRESNRRRRCRCRGPARAQRAPTVGALSARSASRAGCTRTRGCGCTSRSWRRWRGPPTSPRPS